MDALYYLRYVEAAVPPLVFLLSLWSLLESKYSARVTWWTALGVKNESRNFCKRARKIWL